MNVKLQDKLIRTFIVDTGSSSSLISDTVVKELGLETRPGRGDDGRPLVIPGTGGRQADLVFIPRFQLSRTTLSNVPLAVIKADSLHSLAGPDIDGILGANLLVPGAMLIQPEKQLITLYYPGGLSKAAVEDLGFSTASQVPLTDSDNNLLFRIPVKINKNTNVSPVFDTGAATSVLSAATDEQLGLEGLGLQDIRTVTGIVRCKRAIVQSMSIADVEQSSVLFAFPVDKKLVVTDCIGLQSLLHFEMLADYANKKLYIRPARATPLK